MEGYLAMGPLLGKDCFSVEQVSEKLGVCQETVRRWIRSGALKTNKASYPRNCSIISKEQLGAFLTTHPKYRKDNDTFNSLACCVSLIEDINNHQFYISFEGHRVPIRIDQYAQLSEALRDCARDHFLKGV